jgi:hypothetical protein
MAKVPPVPSAVNCRCSTSPWGDVAVQQLFPNSTQVGLPVPPHVCALVQCWSLCEHWHQLGLTGPAAVAWRGSGCPQPSVGSSVSPVLQLLQLLFHEVQRNLTLHSAAC